MSSNINAFSPTVLVILDGFGYRQAPENNAIFHARTPNFDRLWETGESTLVSGSGLDVGLPAGQMGNSRVTIENLEVLKIMSEEGLLVVKGAVPGHKGATVIVRKPEA